MSLVIVKCINNLVMSLAIIFTAMYLTEERVKLVSLNTIFWLIISIAPSFIFSAPGYNMIFTFFFIFVSSIVN